MAISVTRLIPKSIGRRWSFGVHLLTPSFFNSSNGGYKRPEDNHPDDYKTYQSTKKELLNRRLTDPNRFQHISEREECSIVPAAAVKSMTNGKYLCDYRGIDIFKGPEDLSIMYQLLCHVRPQTIIEMGAFSGGSALWMADSLNGSNIDCKVFSVDLDLSLLSPQTKLLQPPNLEFIEGDCYQIEKALPSEFLMSLPRPLLLIDDVHENCDNVLDYFHGHLIVGDYIVYEDTNPDVPDVIFGDGDWGYEKLHTWSKFLAKHGDMYAVDTFFCDLFGYNYSSNWNGYARRMK